HFSLEPRRPGYHPPRTLAPLPPPRPAKEGSPPEKHRGPPRRRPEPGAAGRGRPPQPLPLRPAVQGGHRASPAPVRHGPPRRTGAAAPARRRRLLPGGGRHARRLLGPEPVLPSLQAHSRRHAGAVPDARKNRLTGRKLLQETGRRPP